MRSNLIIHVKSFWSDGTFHSYKSIGGNYVPARPEGFSSLTYRIQATWLVWTGRADALVWPAGQ